MSMMSILRAGKSMANKSFFFTLVLSLSTLGNAYGKIKTFIEVRNLIPKGYQHFSKKGYTVKASGKGVCMYRVTPSSYVAIFGDLISLRLYYKSSWNCAFRDSTQKFEVINNDSGSVVGTFKWHKPLGLEPRLIITKNPGSIMADITGEYVDKRGILNLRSHITPSSASN
ncbi:hypothetical protein [Candidatus Sororendozoicomonas aggregata]|uniref:hypothetical protein n=1 Tax=Candidatus Sororendozoicomonas aggregata TaxID=3073239 RepID=UPI002ED2B0CE